MGRLSIGKRNEFTMWAKLLAEEIDVYPALVDDKGIDGLIGYGGNYFEVQIKSGGDWTTPRGISYDACKKNPKRIFIIYNYVECKIIFLTGKEILEEPEWEKTIRYEISQLKWNKKLLEKYSNHNFENLIKSIKSNKLWVGL